MVQRILVAEDEPVIAYDLCDTFEEAGYEVEGPYSGVETASSACRQDRPDLAILDIKLGDGDVFALAERLDALNVPIIFHSGRLEECDVKARFPRAMTLIKPCPPADMIGAVTVALESRLTEA